MFIRNYLLKKNNQGMIALSLAFILMIIMITVVIMVGTTVFQRIRIAGEIQNQHIAFHLAETGIEKARNKLMLLDCGVSISPQEIVKGEEKWFWFSTTRDGGICTIRSFGSFRGTTRFLTITLDIPPPP